MGEKGLGQKTFKPMQLHIQSTNKNNNWHPEKEPRQPGRAAQHSWNCLKRNLKCTKATATVQLEVEL